ncbi:MAG: S41 family peptidase [Phycisphaerae bacterium]
MTSIVNRRWMGRIALTGILLVSVALVWAAGPDGEESADSGDQTAAKTDTAPSRVEPTNPYEKFRKDGFAKAVDGEFHAALKELNQAVALHPDDKQLAQAVKMLKKYNQGMQSVVKDRKDEYEQAAQRVRRGMLAWKHQVKLKERKLFDKLHEKVFDDAAAAYNKTALSADLLTTDPNAMDKLRKETIDGLKKSIDHMTDAAAMLKDDDDVFAREFTSHVDAYKAVLHEYIDAWKAASVQTPDAIDRSVETLEEIEDRIADALADAETYVATKPWQIALSQARLAKEIAVDKDEATESEWYKEVVELGEKVGKQAMEDAEWQDALNAYAGLYEIDRDSETYETQREVAARHVRVLRLYGSEKPKEATTQPTTQSSATTWKEIAAEIDGRMVEDAISRMSRAYVSSIDYRKLTHSGLRAVKILAETPQAANTFEGLKDKDKKAQFIEAIDRAMKQFDKRTRLDSLCLQLAMNKVLFASEDTVGIPTKVLAMEFTDGFLEELDQFSSMIWPSEVEDFTKLTMGKFIGVGIQINKAPGQPLKVVTPLVGSPAYKAGIKSNDEIIAVDGVDTVPLTVNKLVRMITGKEGTTVTLTIKRVGLPKPREVKVVRREIRIRTVKGWRRRENGEWDYLIDPEHKIGYIRVTQFTRTTASNVATALKELRGQGVSSVVLDLRFNPGGLLRSARDVSAEFLASGTVVTTKGRQIARQVLRVTGEGNYHTGDLVVLVNELSASAAEIVSGALQDWDRATIVGQRSYGKGSVQNVINLGDGRAYLKLTTAYYYLPSNRLLHRRNGDKKWGVDPDVSVYITPDQMREWLDIRRKTDLVQEVDPEQQELKLKKQFQADIQLRSATMLLKMMKLRKSPPVETVAKDRDAA